MGSQRHPLCLTPTTNYYLLKDFLYRELCRESWSPLLMNHDFLHGLQLRYAVFYTELCVECISDWNLAPQEVLFSSGRKCSNMLFVASGEVFYSTSSSSTRRTAEQPIHGKDFHTVMPSDDLQLIDQTLGPGDWLCEQCLWTPWHYRGRAESLAGATMLCLSDDKLQKAASVHKEVATELVVYARLFVSALNAALSDGLSDLPIVLP
ncbi:unnamed protein product [Symbiodinium natans]|uniref:Cyclic nucleotide-binding domain-containing protein n=1 Tax=Symbiodinium natans TaxID=878477 RepID=A0A812U268_9DINO|nr:unnamed protein product [Symbiodinium natans]